MYENYIWPTLPLYEAQIDIQVLRLKRLTRAYFIRLGRELLHSLHVFLTESINIANDGSGGNSEEIIHHDSPGESASPWSGTHATKAPSPRVRRRSLLQYKGLPSLPSKKIRDPISLPLNARPHGAHPNSQFQRSRSFSAGPAYS